MKSKDGFRIIEFQNPKSVAFRIIGRKPDGTVVRENLKDYAHALARKQELEIDSINSPVVLIMQPTRLPDRRCDRGPHAGRPGSGVTLCVVDYVVMTLVTHKMGGDQRAIHSALGSRLNLRKLVA